MPNENFLMNDKRNNCIILLVEAPVPENADPELRAAFGAERAARINCDLLKNAYKLAKNFTDAMLILSFEKSPRNPDLTWLDGEDPGFLEADAKNRKHRIANASRLAFNTGVKKVLLLNHLSPDIKAESLSEAFDSVNDKTIALGLNQDASAYIVGLTQNNMKLLENISPFSPKAAAEIAEKAKKNKLSVFTLPEGFAVKNEETLNKWLGVPAPAPAPYAQAPSPAAEPAPQPAQRRHEGKKHHRHGPAPAFVQPPLPDTGPKPV